MGNFRDVLINEEANATITAFMRRKIRERVKDAAVAEKLIPTNHGFGTRRVPLESGYYEVYNSRTCASSTSGDADRANHAGRREDERRAVRGGHDHLRHRLRRHHRGLRPNRHPGRAVSGCGRSGRTARARTWGCRSRASRTCSRWSGRTTRPPFCNIPRCIEQNVDW